MGQNQERLGRLQSNRSNMFAGVFRTVQTVQRKSTVDAIDTASAGVKKAAGSDGFEGNLGDRIRARLLEIHGEIDRFTEYQHSLNKAITLADEALEETAAKAGGVPAAELSSDQRSTVDMATSTGSPVQVAPGVTMTAKEAEQYYQHQADLEQEEAARKLTAALDQRLQEIIDGMPTSEYDPPKPQDDPSGDGAVGGDPTVDGSGLNGGGAGTGSGTGGANGTGGYDGPRVVRPDDPDHNTVGDPDYDDTRDPEPPRHLVDPPRYVGDPPYYPPYDPDGPPNIDGGNDGVVPGGPGGPGSPGGPRLPYPGGTAPGGVLPGGGGPGGIGGLVGGTSGGVGGAALAGGLSRAGGIGAAGGINSMNAATGASGGAGTSGVVAQSGSGAAGRAGMMAGGGATGAGGAGKRKRRRGQDLLAFEVDPEDDGTTPDLGAAGAAGSSASDGREDLGW